MDVLRNWLALAAVPGLDGLKYQRLTEHITLAELVRQPASTLRQIGFTARQAEIFSLVSPSLIDSALQWCDSGPDHHIITYDDPAYPPLLRQTKQPPLLLFVKGSVAVLSQPQVAMVGSRQPTPTGKQVAKQFAAELTRHGFLITSGLARGIDSYSHQGALSAGGLTVAVLGHGLRQVYPKSNIQLAEQITAQGALVSEYFPDVGPRAEHFPQRNRIVVGLSQGTLVVEAAIKSGSLISANLAAEYSRDVFAVPGSIYNPQVAGCHQLIQQGAKLVMSVADILEEWSFFPKNGLNKITEQQKNPVMGLSDQQLLANVGDETTAVDVIAERANMPVADVTIALLQLELTGVVAAVPGGYIRVRST
ncbi:DNA-processing protein DprA [Chromatiaceae bacterium AAb-1]|nr:DNA-processing protein DprA [Chromatiaceae bacterium AAb-1]